jgi:hypothetical protein
MTEGYVLDYDAADINSLLYPTTRNQEPDGSISFGSMICPNSADLSKWEVENGAVTEDSDGKIVITRTDTDGGDYAWASISAPLDLRARYVVFDIEGLDGQMGRLWYTFTHGSFDGTTKYDAPSTTLNALINPGRSILPIHPAMLTGGTIPEDGLQDTRRVGLRLYGPSSGTETQLKIHSVKIYDTIRPPGALIIFFDDGWDGVYDNAFPAMQEHGLIGTIAVETSNVGNADRASLTELQEMHNAGWHLCSHGARGDQNESDADLRASQQWLMDQGFARAAKHFVYGGGAVSNIEDVKKYYLSARSVSSGPPLFWPITSRHRYHGGIFVNPDTTVESALRGINYGALMGGVHCITFHNVVTGVPTGTEWDVTRFEDWCAQVAASGIKTLGVADVFGPDQTELAKIF